MIRRMCFSGDRIAAARRPASQLPNVEIVVYPGAGHGFHADYRPSYTAAAASDAWKRCNDWFTKYLKG